MQDETERFEVGREVLTAPAPTVDRVSVRLPPFWPEDPEIWFAQIEAQFEISGTKTDATKFYMVIQQLDHKIAREVRDIITNPPRTEKYDRLKQELIKRLSTSRDQRIRQLLTHEELGDRKPSQFLRHLRSLASDGVSDDFLRSLWANRLPSHVQAIIASQKSASLDEIAELADKVCEVTPSTSSQVASASGSHFDAMLKRMEDVITRRVETEIAAQLAQLDLRGQRGRPYERQHSRSSGRSRSRNRGQSQSRTPGMCWYHDIYKEKARRCRPPCNYNTKKQENYRSNQ